MCGKKKYNFKKSIFKLKGVTIYSALRQCNLLPGECVALSGAGGGLGSLGIQYARSMGRNWIF